MVYETADDEKPPKKVKRTEKPRYIVGDYAPSDEFKGAPFYSGLGLE